MTEAASPDGAGGGGRSAPLRIDAQRNLEHVLRAAREVFGELGYGAPMEDVARRARVGVGTVYRRFPSKEVLVRRIAEEETARLTEQARTALSQETDPWAALARFLRSSVASGAGRLLPPRVLRAGADGAASQPSAHLRVPHQRQPADSSGGPDLRLVADTSAAEGDAAAGEQRGPLSTGAAVSGPRAGEARGEAQEAAAAGEVAGLGGGGDGDAGTGVEAVEGEGEAVTELLAVVSQLVDRARESGSLREDVTVADVLLVIATTAPSLPDAEQQAEASTRLLDILLQGLRSREGA